MRLSIVALVGLLPFAAYSTHISFALSSGASFNPASLPSSTQSSLYKLGTHLTAPLTRRNTFEFKDVTSGSYLFTVQCKDFAFAPLRVDVRGNGTNEAGQEMHRVDAWQTFWGNEWSNKGEWLGGGEASSSASQEDAVTVTLKVDRKREYYQKRIGFSPLDFLKNPMMLMAIVSLGFVVGMPYLMDNMDEETKAEFQAIQERSPLTQATNAASLQNFDLAGWMARRANDDKTKTT